MQWTVSCTFQIILFIECTFESQKSRERVEQKYKRENVEMDTETSLSKEHWILHIPHSVCLSVDIQKHDEKG